MITIYERMRTDIPDTLEGAELWFFAAPEDLRLEVTARTRHDGMRMIVDRWNTDWNDSDTPVGTGHFDWIQAPDGFTFPGE